MYRLFKVIRKYFNTHKDGYVGYGEDGGHIEGSAKMVTMD